MKTRFILSGFVAAAVIALSGCDKVESVSNAPEESSVYEAVPFTLGVGLDTRTANDGVSTKWVENDQINVFHAVAGSTTYVSDSLFKADDAGATVDFSGTIKETLNASGNYDWYAIYPYNKNIVTPASTSAGYLTVGSAANGTQTQTGLNSTAHISGKNYPIGGVASNVAATEKPQIVMKHLSTLMEVVVTNGLPSSSITVTGVSLTAQEDIVGTYYINFVDPDYPIFTGSGTTYVSTTASLVVNSSTAIGPGESAKFYLAVKPFSAESGKDLTIGITTAEFGQQNITKQPSSDLDFEAGKKNTLNATYTKSGTSVNYTLVNSVDDLTLGSEIILVYTDGNLAASPLGSATYMAGKTVGISGNQIGDPAGVEVFTIANGTIAGTYALKCASGSGEYLTWNSGTSLSLSSTLSNAGSWGINIEPTGKTVIRSIAEPSRYMLFSSTNDRISTYIPNTGYYDVNIYKNMTTGSGSITPKTAASLSVSGATTAFSVGGTFAFDGSVILTYSDLTSSEISSSEYTVDASEVNMSAAGTYNVKITYNADSSIYTTYSVSVSSSSAVTATILFGKATGHVQVTSTSATGKDSANNTWTITTVTSSSSFTQQDNYSQIGSSKKPATSITFTTTLASSATITDFSISLGGFSGTAGTVTLKVGDTTVGSGSLNATSDVTVSATKSATGTVLTATITGISKGVKAYGITYTYE